MSENSEAARGKFVNGSHSVMFGYLLWLFGFTGAHRFYYGRPVTGTVWFFTFGLFGIGWLIDAFLIPGMEASAERRYVDGPYKYTVAWILLTFLGIFGVHRFYMGKVWTGLLYLVTGGLLGAGVIFDFWSLNEQVTELNLAR